MKKCDVKCAPEMGITTAFRDLQKFREVYKEWTEADFF